MRPWQNILEVRGWPRNTGEPVFLVSNGHPIGVFHPADTFGTDDTWALDILDRVERGTAFLEEHTKQLRRLLHDQPTVLMWAMSSRFEKKLRESKLPSPCDFSADIVKVETAHAEFTRRSTAAPLRFEDFGREVMQAITNLVADLRRAAPAKISRLRTYLAFDKGELSVQLRCEYLQRDPLPDQVFASVPTAIHAIRLHDLAATHNAGQTKLLPEWVRAQLDLGTLASITLSYVDIHQQSDPIGRFHRIDIDDADPWLILGPLGHLFVLPAAAFLLAYTPKPEAPPQSCSTD